MVQKWLKDIHWSLFISMIMLASIGILFIYSASYADPAKYEVRQAFWALVGFSIFLSVPLVGYRTFLNMSYLLYTITIILLLLVALVGETRFGAQRWLAIGPFSMQPSEFAKLTTVMALANYLGTRNAWERDIKTIATACGIVLLPMVLIMKQPDLGSSLLFIPILFVLLFLWGIRYRYIIFSVLAGLVSAPLMWFMLKEYQKKRIQVFLNPKLDPLGAGYTAIQSKIGVGSGGFSGKGFLQGTQSQLNFVPEHHTDFIFCIIGEEWGFVGSLLIIALYAVFFNAFFQIIQSTTDERGKLLGGGILAVFLAQVLINIGMTIGLMPITGLTLPLVSYGGSSLLMSAFALGLVLSIHKERSIF